MVASFDTSGLFSGFEGATSKNTGSSTFEIKEGPIQGLGFWNHITRGLAAITGLFGILFNVSSEETINTGAQAPGSRTHITDTLTTLARALVMAVMLHYVSLTLGSFLYNRVASTNTNGQPETFGGITNAEDGLALVAVPAAEKWNRGSNRLVSVMVDIGASGHYFDDALIPGLRYRLDNYQALVIRWWITTAGEHQLEEAGQGLLRGHSIGAQSLKRLTRLSLLAGPAVEWDLFSVKQDGALSGGESLSRTHGPSRRQLTPTAMREGNATQSMREHNDNDCTHLSEIATNRTLSQLRRLGLYIEAFLTDIAHQTDEAESVVEYACAATNSNVFDEGGNGSSSKHL